MEELIKCKECNTANDRTANRCKLCEADLI